MSNVGEVILSGRSITEIKIKNELLRWLLNTDEIDEKKKKKLFELITT